ncbi:DUF4272 domain-containing protein [Massilia sp. AB1]|uniref:DUF4272 domain-containing protein n=1 Tax=Massilia sp. AB1 TaxID=2823371 RepID=UPI001B842D70|nr:DUF4272 domain-containing protein [Massilia sp. AB1]MBQ5942237.1 DUF4272 domain-containing protein [Massilia sp. AB1]
MTPAQRQAASEALLREHGIPINPQLPWIEDEHEVRLRSADELCRRLAALWGVVGTAMLRENDFFEDYFSIGDRRSWLSNDEARFLFDDEPVEEDYIRFSWRLEALYFLAWCGGLVEQIGLPRSEASAREFLHFFPEDEADPVALAAAVRVRPVGEILDWSDRLYRLHWAVRDAHLNGRPTPGGIEPGVVFEWHYAVNWMTRYDGEDDWDEIGTDT